MEENKLTKEMFANGRILKPMVYKAFHERCEENLNNAYFALRNTPLYVPVRIKISPEDQDKFANGKAGDTITTDQPLRFVPATIEAYDGKFLPAFSDIEDLKKQFEGASSIGGYIPQVIEMFEHMTGVEAICVDPFVCPFIIDPPEFDFLRSLELAYEE